MRSSRSPWVENRPVVSSCRSELSLSLGICNVTLLSTVAHLACRAPIGRLLVSNLRSRCRTIATANGGDSVLVVYLAGFWRNTVINAVEQWAQSRLFGLTTKGRSVQFPQVPNPNGLITEFYVAVSDETQANTRDWFGIAREDGLDHAEPHRHKKACQKSPRKEPRPGRLPFIGTELATLVLLNWALCATNDLLRQMGWCKTCGKLRLHDDTFKRAVTAADDAHTRGAIPYTPPVPS